MREEEKTFSYFDCAVTLASCRYNRENQLSELDTVECVFNLLQEWYLKPNNVFSLQVWHRSALWARSLLSSWSYYPYWCLGASVITTTRGSMASSWSTVRRECSMTKKWGHVEHLVIVSVHSYAQYRAKQWCIIPHKNILIQYLINAHNTWPPLCAMLLTKSWCFVLFFPVVNIKPPLFFRFVGEKSFPGKDRKRRRSFLLISFPFFSFPWLDLFLYFECTELQ